MTFTKTGQRLLLLVIFALLMLVTRSHHIATPLHLPDASVALFFLAGLFLRGRWGYLATMMIAAGAIDYWAINYNGVSSFCVSPAYMMLVPTYALLWFGGSWVSRRVEAGHRLVPAAAGSILVSGFAAHLLSSGSFYFFSGVFADTTLLHFAERTLQYAPAYVGFAAMYVGIATLLCLLFLPQGAEGSELQAH